MTAFPELETNRLKLRKVVADDIPSIVKYGNNRKIADNVLNVPHPYQDADAVLWIRFAHEGFKNKRRYVFAVVLKETDEFIGAVGLHINDSLHEAELGYWLGEPFWNKGIMTEAIKEVLHFGFGQLALSSIYATTFIDNNASGKVLANNGMIMENEMKDHYKVGDLYKSVFLYRITRKETDIGL